MSEHGTVTYRQFAHQSYDVLSNGRRLGSTWKLLGRWRWMQADRAGRVGEATSRRKAALALVGLLPDAEREKCRVP